MTVEAEAGKFAIIGIGCRMPPNANSLEAFWKFLLKGGNALKPIKKDRWDWRQYGDEDPNRPGKTYAPKGAFLDADIQQFDPLAFGISPREAAALDPQQRLLLESTWEAFEDAGLPLERVSGSLTSVFVGGFCLDHLVLQAQPSNRHLINAHSPGGVMMTVLSNRISHAFNLRGPSLTLDTACSSSLVALHYACQSLRTGEADMALAGGVNVMSRPEFPIIMSKGHFLSHHGECHAFDESAAGYARGEGAGILVIKRLGDALAAGDPIHAVVCGTGVNQDGHTDGISLPNSEAQETLAARVYREAGLACADVDYVEAHGTGTQAGDSAELGALHRNFTPGRKKKLWVGSVKTNIGHLEAAAGVAGLLKTIGVLKFRQIPKNLHFVQPNPKIPFADYALEVVKETTALAPVQEKETLYAGINSFGYGGTNAHAVLASPPARVANPAVAVEGERIFPLSAHDENALRDLAGKYAFLLGKGLPGTREDLLYSAAFRRSHLPRRLVARSGSLEDLRQQLIAASTGQTHEGLILGDGASNPGQPLAFVYTGMGPQWWGMGQQLAREEPVFAAALDEVDQCFRALSGWSLKEAMLAPEETSRMARTELAQPANFALQVGLTRLWASYGIRPDAVVGHSVGEVTAAYVAGVYSLEEAVLVSYHRSRLQQTMAGRGAMLAVGLAETEAAQMIADLPGVSIAAVNSFDAVTLSGETDPLQRVAADLEQRGLFQKFLRVEVAYHSPQMDPLQDELLEVLSGLSPRPATLPLVSTTYGKIVPAERWDAEYWWRNVRQSVRFADAVKELLDDKISTFLEVGPHPVLGNSIKECAAHLERKNACFTTLRRQEPEQARVWQTLGELYCAGQAVDWTALAPKAGQFVPGPQYCWQRSVHWLESDRSKMERLGLPGPVYLNRTVLGPRPCWEVEINRNYFPFLFDHGVQDQTVFAGMGYIEAALSLSREIHQKPAVVLENVSFERVLIVDPAKLQVLMTEFDAEGGRFAVSSRTEGEEKSVLRHCRGRLIPQTAPQPGQLDLKALAAQCPEPVTLEAFHERLRRRELHYGESFTRPISEIRVGADCFLVKVDARADVKKDHPLSPPLFDAALRAVLYCARGERLFVPFSFEQFCYFSAPESASCYAYGKLVSQSDTQIMADVWLADEKGRVHVHARRLSLQVIEMGEKAAEADSQYRWEWKESALSSGSFELSGGDVLILADSEDSDLELASELASRLPGSVVKGRPGADGFGQDGWKQVLAENDRRHLIVLWGSETKPGSDAEAVMGLNEKFIGLFQAAGAGSSDRDVTLVTRGTKAAEVGDLVPNLAAASAGAIGLVAQNEFAAVMCRQIDLAGDKAGAAERVLAEISADSRGEVAYRKSRRLEKVLSAVRDDRETEARVSVSLDEPVVLRLGVPGRRDALAFESCERREPGEGEIEVRVHRAGLTERDALKRGGHLPPVALENTFSGSEMGLECSGEVVRCGPGSRFAVGDQVVALAAGGLRSYAVVREGFARQIPPGLDERAAAIPFDYLTAYRGLVDIANLQPGERVLILEAGSGAGRAAVTVARWLGAEIFATAETEAHRNELGRQGVERVYSSADWDYGQAIRDATGQEGVDVVFGEPGGQALQVGLSLLRPGGRYVATGKKDAAEDNDLPLRAFNRNILFASVDIDRLAQERPVVIERTLDRIFERFAAGDFQLGPVQAVPASGVADALEELASGRSAGKILADFSEGGVEVIPAAVRAPVIRRDGCYLVTGGTSGFGLATAAWLAEQGAGRVLLVSRSGSRAPGVTEEIRRLQALGATVEALAVDVTDPAQVGALIAQASSPGCPLRGILHGAMVLEDALMADLNEESFRRVFRPKAMGALNLAGAVKDCEELDFFVFFSSISSIIGNRGQTSYVAANGLLDSLAEKLRAEGRPALSLNWGALAESGVVARDERLGALLSSSGLTGLSNQDALRALDQALRLAVPQLGVFLVDWRQWHEAHPKLAVDPRFREQRVRPGQGSGNAIAAKILEQWEGSSKEQRLRALESQLQEVLAKTLKMAKDAIPVNRKLNEMGVDSLMVLELSLGIKEQIGVSFSAMEFLRGPNIEELAVMAESKLWA